ncbi:MAG: dockerin type I repeat-containing protein [Gemmatimonadota bacterium]|nr:MAG: dockerin type I repeat-containing protein [Gemmatimonadota bacterium]
MLKLFEFASDADGDGVIDGKDNCLYEVNVDQEDGDGDSTGDVCDNCPHFYNPDQDDSDGDTIGDACDACTDTDGDGYGDPGYPSSTCDGDNCPIVSNPDQAPVDRGDVDCRGGIDVLDVLAVARHIVSSPPLAGEPFHRADCNDDGHVDILDALGMINVILGLSHCEPTTLH